MLAKWVGVCEDFGYAKMLDKEVLPWADDNLRVEWVYEQNITPDHASLVAKDWFKSQGIRIMKWPSRSPDPNPIEIL